MSLSLDNEKQKSEKERGEARSRSKPNRVSLRVRLNATRERINPAAVANGFVEYSKRAVVTASKAYRGDELLSRSCSRKRSDGGTFPPTGPD